MTKLSFHAAFPAILLLAAACGSDFLGLKQDRNAAIPATLTDVQAILDNDVIMNNSATGLLGFLGGDEYYVSDQSWLGARNAYERQAYLWADDVHGDLPVRDWDYAYKRILHCNVALDVLATLEAKPGEENAYRLAKGSALFFRAHEFFSLAQLFCTPYPVTGQPDASALGIPLRLEADITAPVVRASLTGTYDRILLDLKTATQLLPVERLVEQRPSKPAAHALLARVYLQMGRYPEALAHADTSLAYRDELIDFNTVDASRVAENLFDGLRHRHPEVYFSTRLPSNTIATPYANLYIDTALLRSYDPDDLRRPVYFQDQPNGNQWFRASYIPIGSWFSGLAVNETLLIKAECHARLGQAAQALVPLNRLLAHRMDAADFTPLALSDLEAVLGRVIAERRKELVLRGLRWGDLRRLNQEPRFATTPVRVINGQRHELPPGSPRYTWPIPEAVIRQSGIAQNPR